MLGVLARHSFLAILLAVMIEELGLPMPIPTDVLIVFAGTTAEGSVPYLALLFVALTLASAIGGSVLYAIVRRGGRPLVDRFGSYVHLGPARLARAEALLERGGWKGIALGRMTPGVRYATVIVCGLLKVPFPRYFLAHVAGSSVYVAFFLTLGAVFGPTVLDQIRLPALEIRLLWLLALAIGLPALILWWGSRVHSRLPEDPSRRRLLGAVLLSSFFGTIALAATFSAIATVTELLGASRPLNVTYDLLGRLLLGVRQNAEVSSLLLYAVLLALLTGTAVAYYELVLPYLARRGGKPHEVSLLRQVLGLSLLALGLFGLVSLLALLLVHDGSFGPWQRAPSVLPALVLGVAIYASTTVYGHTLAVTVTPSLRRRNVR